jgi:cytochrome c6
MLKRDTSGWSSYSDVHAIMTRAGKNLRPYPVLARVMVLLAVLMFVGSAATLRTARAAEPDAGAQIFEVHCAMCHGPDGRGDTVIGKSAGIPDLHSADVQKQSDAYLAEFIADGKGVMPPFKNSLSSDQINTLVAHVRALAQKK